MFGPWGARSHKGFAFSLSLRCPREIEAPRFEAEALAFRGDVHRLAGRNRQAVADLEQALLISRRTGMAYLGPWYLGLLAVAADDPEVQAAKKYAQAARTDLEKRKRLRNYYEVYYQRMSALATTPELKLALQALKDVHQIILTQPRVRPTPTPEFSGTPSPTPSSTPAKKKTKEKHKKKKVHK